MTLTRSFALSATLAALALNVASAADEYQWEAGLGVSQTTSDDSVDTKATAISAFGEYHLAPVKLADHPWEEAAFLEHSTFVDASVSYLTLKNDNIDADGAGIHVGFTYATPEFPLRLSAGVGFSKVSDEDDIKTTVFDLDAGYWIKPELIVGLRLASSKISTDGVPDDNKELDISAYGKWVVTLNDEVAFNAEAELGRHSYDNGEKDSNTAIEVAGDVYFRKQYGIGLSLGTESGDADAAEGTTIGIRGSAWFTQQIGVRVGYEKFTVKDDDFGVDDDTLFLEVVGRF
jgi:hypothetical protein